MTYACRADDLSMLILNINYITAYINCLCTDAWTCLNWHVSSVACMTEHTCNTFVCTHVSLRMNICCVDSKYVCMHACTHDHLNCLHAQILVFKWLEKKSSHAPINGERALQSKEKWRKQPTTVQIPLSYFLLFYNRSETSSELMRVMLRPNFCQDDISNEATTRLPRGKAMWLALPSSEMAADAKAVFCFAECRSSIWNLRCNFKANCWHANSIRAR